MYIDVFAKILNFTINYFVHFRFYKVFLTFLDTNKY